MPAHATMLYPFVAPERLVPSVRARLLGVVASVQPFDYVLAGQGIWPDVIYVAVDPESAFVDLQRVLGAAFPTFPVYGPDRDFEFVPHVTIAEDPGGAEPTILGDRGWRSLPVRSHAVSIEVIAQPAGGRWRTIWRLPLGRMPP